jgi:hypothetical protein
MQTRRSLRYVITRTGGSAATARRAPSPGTGRARLARKLAVPALAFASFGATAAASPGIGGDAAAGAPAVTGRAIHARLDSAGCAARLPMRPATRERPWMYAIVNGKPWMYAIVNGKPWMYAIVNGKPWMYAITAGHAAAPRACPTISHRVS